MTRWEQLLAEVDRVFTYRDGPFYVTRAMRDELRAALVVLIEEQRTADLIANACDETGITTEDDVPAHIRRLAWRRLQSARADAALTRELRRRARLLTRHDASPKP